MKKYNRLKEFLSDLGSVVLALSGGLDSGFLAKSAYDVLGRNVIAVTATSAIHAEEELAAAENLCKRVGIRHEIVQTDELSIFEFRRNSHDRCYWCKRNLISKLKDIADKRKVKYVIDGTNYDDRKDSRPGIQANNELAVISPLFECKFSKKDIIAAASDLKLSFGNKLKTTCLASRITFGEEINLKKLEMVRAAESILKEVLGGNFLVRARTHGDLLRLEIGNREWTKLKKSDINKVMPKLKKLGYKYVTVDLEGYIPAGKR